MTKPIAGCIQGPKVYDAEKQAINHEKYDEKFIQCVPNPHRHSTNRHGSDFLKDTFKGISESNIKFLIFMEKSNPYVKQ